MKLSRFKNRIVPICALVLTIYGGSACVHQGQENENAFALALASFQHPNIQPLPEPSGATDDYSMDVRDTRGRVNFAFQTTVTIDVKVSVESASPTNLVRFRELKKNVPGAVIYQGVTNLDGIAQGNFTVNTTVAKVLMEFSANGRGYSIPVSLDEVLKIDRLIAVKGAPRTRALNALVDSDGDGIADAVDHFPNDPALATRLSFPSQGRYTIAYEDLYPRRGDADFNDYVTQVRFVEELNAAGQVVRLRGSFRHAAKAAGYNHKLRLTLPGMVDASYTVQRFGSDGGLISTTANYVAAFQDIALTPSSNQTIPQANAHRGQDFKPGDLFVLEVLPDVPLSKSALGGAPYDLYLYVLNTQQEVHFAGKFFDSAGKDRYLDSAGFPWALLVPVDWRWMYERNNIHEAYEFFDNWYSSGGRVHRDWYLFPDLSKVFENTTTYFSPEPEFVVPSGYNRSDFVIEESLLPVPPRIGEHYVPVGKIYDIRPTAGGSISFGNSRAEIRYQYDAAALVDAGFVEEFVVFYYDSSVNEWKRLRDVRVDAAAGTVTAFTDHLTPFVLTALPVPPGGQQAPAGPSCIADDYPGGITGSGSAVFSTVDAGFNYYQDRTYTIVPPGISPTNATTFAALGFEQALGISTCNGSSALCGPFANHKLFTGNNYVSFTAHTALDVYVMYDTRGGTGVGDTSQDAPWLTARGFVDTGFLVETTDAVGFYTVYRNSYGQGQLVQLDGNRQGAGLAINTNYWVIIKPQGDTSNSGAQSLCVANPDTAAPGTVSSLRGAPGAGEVILFWQNPADADFAGVVIRRSNTLPAPTKISEGTAPGGTVLTPQSFRDTSVLPGNTYHYTVFALDADNNYRQPGVSVTITTGIDTDGDGLSDNYEISTDYSFLFPGSPPPSFTCAFGPCGSGVPADTDGDGVQDGVEVGLGTDPTNPETTAPTITGFTRAGPPSGTNPVVNFTAAATDNIAVTGYLVTLTDGRPLSSHNGWQGAAPTSFTLPGVPGTYQLYLWAKDAAGNVSAPFAPISFQVLPRNFAETAILRASNATSADVFGASVAVDGDYAVVGAYNANIGARRGIAYIYERDGAGNWNEVAQLFPAITPGVFFFGWSVSISGNRVVASTLSAAYVFERDGAGNWNEVATLVGVGGNETFGGAVAISGDYLVVGAPGGPNTHSGSAYVFERDGAGNWNQRAVLTGSDSQLGDSFGSAVAINGNRALIGASNEDGGAGNPRPNGGAAYLFERDGAGNWIEQVVLRSSDNQTGDQFGIAVALDGDRLVIAAPSEDGGPGNPISDAGSAYVYERDGGGIWNEVAILRASDRQTGDRFADFTGLSMKGDYIIVGAYHEDGGPGNPRADSGSAYIFQRDAGGTWSETALLRASDTQTGDHFGYSVAISAGHAFVGAQREDGPGNPINTEQGAVYIFE